MVQILFDYIVVDSGFKTGKTRNILFATDEKDEAIEFAYEFAFGPAVRL